MRKRNTSSPTLAALGLCLAALLGACSTDDGPTAPPGGAVPPGGGGGGGASTFVVTVTANPPVLNTGTVTAERAAITITARRADNGQPPANGTTAVVTASQGTFLESGLPSAVVTLVNGQASLTYVPEAGAVGTATIRAELSGSAGVFNIELQQPDDAVFLLSHVEPNVVDPSGGQRVTIFGQNFRAPVRVTIGTTDAEVVSVENDRVRIVVPAANPILPVGETRPVAVNVVSGMGTEFEAADSLSGGLVYSHGGGGGGINQPSVFSITPATGPREGGTRVRILGSGFQQPVQVTFIERTTSRRVEANVLSVSATSLEVLSPPATAFGLPSSGPVVEADIEVRNLSSGLSTLSPFEFRYGVDIRITSIAPGRGPVEGGTLVTIYGHGFDEPVAVSIDGVGGQLVISVTGTEIIFRTSGVLDPGCADISGAVNVVNIESGDSATGPDFTFDVPTPQVFGISPASGPAGGLGAATISGSGFDNPVRVQFGTQTAASSSANGAGTTVTTTVPAFTGSFNTQSCDDNGDGTQGERFVPTSVDVRVINLATGCEDVLTGGFAYNPSDTSCQGDVGDTEPPEPPLPQCSDGLDNDDDGLTDYNGGVTPPGDPECQSDGDNSEAS